MTPQEYEKALELADGYVNDPDPRSHMDAKRLAVALLHAEAERKALTQTNATLMAHNMAQGLKLERLEIELAAINQGKKENHG